MTRGHGVPRILHFPKMANRRNNHSIKIRTVCGHDREFVCPATGELRRLVRVRRAA